MEGDLKYSLLQKHIMPIKKFYDMEGNLTYRLLQKHITPIKSFMRWKTN
jgi:hypothetical protein